MHPILKQSLEYQEMELGLERMERLDRALGSPSKAFPSVHIAGTNGKGSVATKIARNLQNSHRVGLFTSPHITSYRERVQINNVLISEEDADRILKKIVEIEKPTYFEMTALLALCYFAEQKVDIAVLEVGLGGRLDATNIVTPELSIITSISFDHTQILGSTLEEIAREKAGIIKPNIPVILGPKAHLCAPYAKEYFQVEGTFTDYNEENTAIAREALRILKIPIDEEMIQMTPPCRFERIGNVILDVAHNPDGVERTYERAKKQRPIRSLLAFAKDKDVEAMIETAMKYSQAIHLTQDNIARAFQPLTLKPKYTCFLDPDLERAFKTAHRLATEQGQTLLVCGSHYLMGPVRAILGMEPI